MLRRDADKEVTQQPKKMQMTDNDADGGQQCRWQHRHPDNRLTMQTMITHRNAEDEVT